MKPSEAIKVAHILGSLDRGGVEMRTLDLVRSVKNSVSTYMVTLSGREGSLAANYKAEGATVVPMPIYALNFAFKFISFLRRERIDVVHSHIHHTSGFMTFLAMLAGVPIRIVHYRSDGCLDHQLALVPRIKAYLLRKLIRLSATRIIAVSPDTLSYAWDAFWSKDPRCSVLVNGFDLGPYERSLSALPNDTLEGITRPFILHLGRADSPTKNREGAIEIFAEYCRSGGSGTLIFVGRDGKDERQSLSHRERWRAATDSYGITDRVMYLGERDDIIQILHSVDVLLFTSTLEGLPGVLVESRFAGVPVVATDLPGCRFLAAQLPGIRLLAVTDSTESWVQALEDALTHPLTAEDRIAALESMRGSDFDMTRVVEKYTHLWTVER